MSLNDKPAVIDVNAAYGLAEIQGRMKLGKAAWRSARAEGLPVRKVGRRRYVLGRDVVEWLATKPLAETPHKGQL